MDSMGEEQIDYEVEVDEFQKILFQETEAIPALFEGEIGDEEYDDLYKDVNVGENYLPSQQPDEQPEPVPVNNQEFQLTNHSDSKVEDEDSPGEVIPDDAAAEKYSSAEERCSDHLSEGEIRDEEVESVDYPVEPSVCEKEGLLEPMNGSDEQNKSFRRTTVPTVNVGVRHASDSFHNSCLSKPSSVSRPFQYQVPIADLCNSAVDNGSTVLLVGELQWWTTDAEIEDISREYGKVKQVKFYDERASGKSKGCCQVEFYDACDASMCKERMNGHVINGRACVVSFSSPQMLREMGAFPGKTQTQFQPFNQSHGRRSMSDAGRGSRGGWGRSGYAFPNRGNTNGGPMRGRGVMGGGSKSIAGNNPTGMGSVINSGGGYGQVLVGPTFMGPAGAAAVVTPQGMIGAGFDTMYNMGRGGAYQGFMGVGYSGMIPSFPTVNPMGFAGMAPQVNPAFFGRGMSPNGFGMMASPGLDGSSSGAWLDTNMQGWGEENGRRISESNYGGDDASSGGGYDHCFGEVSNEKRMRLAHAQRKRHFDDKEDVWDSHERESRHLEERESFQVPRLREYDSGEEDEDYSKKRRYSPD